MPKVVLIHREEDRLKEKLLLLMRQQHLTNDKMAQELGISRATFQKRLNAPTKTWTIEELQKAFKAVGITFSYSIK